MRDLIDRQAAIEAVNTWDWLEMYLPIHFKKLLEELPSAEKRGRWVKWTRYTIGPDYKAVAYEYTCSECGAEHRPTYDYCPSCGSRNEIDK